MDDQLREILREKARREGKTPTPINMVLHCPRCHAQHIDEADDAAESLRKGSLGEPVWANPPHRSHLCHNCGCIWRPADVPTNGVEKVTTHGKNDTTPIPEPVPNSVWYS